MLKSPISVLPKCCQTTKNCSVSGREPLTSTDWRLEKTKFLAFLQICVEHPGTLHQKHWSVACGKNRLATQKKLTCRYSPRIAMRCIIFEIELIRIFPIVFVDRWACGVIMFTLLVGCPPFWHRKQMVMLRNIMEGKYSFTSPEWADISGKCKSKLNRSRQW